MTANPTPDFDQISGPAAAVLSARLGRPVALRHPRLLKDATRTLVLRYAVAGAGAAPSSVIVKVIRDDPATGFAEWAALAWLSELPSVRELVPGFFGGDLDQRLFLLEDLGPGCTLHELLTTGSAPAAAAALEQLARQMARLHAATLGQAPALLRIRQALPAAAATGLQLESERWLAARERMHAWLDLGGPGRPAGLDACLDQIAAVYAEPGPWLSFTHGDPAPSNNHIAGAQVRLLDFEYGAFRHALYDITAWDILCPLPPAAVRLMRAAFQTTLAPYLPPAQRARFAEEWALICAFRAMALLSWLTPGDLLAHNRPMVADWTQREAVLAAVTRLLAAISAVPSLAPLATAAARLQRALRTAWPEFGHGDIATRWAALAEI